MEVFDDLGVLDAVRAGGGRYPVGMLWRDGKRLGEHHLMDPVETTEEAPYEGWMVPQWRTQRILRDRLEELGGKIAFGREVTGVTQDEDGVTARFTAGPPLRAQYLVAADGGRSAVRRAVGAGMTGEAVDPLPMLVADVRIAGLDRDNWHMFPPREGRDEFLTLCPLAWHGRLPAGRPVHRGHARGPLPDAVRRVVAARTHLAAEDVTEVLWASDFRPRAALADRFRAGRVFLAGDAAHVHSRPAARASTRPCRTPTTWAGSSARC